MEEPLEGGGHGRGSRMTKQPASAHRKKNAESCLSRSTVRSVSSSVRTGHRFIHQQQLGILGDEHGDLKPLFLAVGQAAGLALGGALAQMPRGRPQRRLVHLDRLREPAPAGPLDRGAHRLEAGGALLWWLDLGVLLAISELIGPGRPRISPDAQVELRSAVG